MRTGKVGHLEMNQEVTSTNDFQVDGWIRDTVPV